MCIYAMFANWRHRYYQHQHEWLRTIIRWRGLFQNTRTKTTTQTLHTFYSSPTTTTTVTAALIRHLSIVVTIKAENICANILKIIYMMVISTSICIAMCVAVVFFYMFVSFDCIVQSACYLLHCTNEVPWGRRRQRRRKVAVNLFLCRYCFAQRFSCGCGATTRNVLEYMCVCFQRDDNYSYVFY